MHDDYYFVLRSVSFELMGSYFAPIKEYLYSLFISVSRVSGLSLRTFEVICYGLALFALWTQIAKLTTSYFVSWITVLPLAIFTYQHPVFNRATYDALQLILTPLSFASALLIFSRKGDLTALFVGALIAGLQTLTRPEGFLFILPPLVSLVYVYAKAATEVPSHSYFWRLSQKALLVCLVPFGMQQCMSMVNHVTFGFWAPTIIKSSEFQASLSALMSIKPTADLESRFAPVPKSSLERAYDVSAEFRKVKPFFDQHMDGKGWSAYAAPDYRTTDGSIPGGHFQWALLDASASVVGHKPEAMLAYLGAVAREIELAFQHGQIEKRLVISTALGPNVSIFDRRLWVSVGKIGAILMNLDEPVLPELAEVGAAPQAESDFNQFTLRRTALVQSESWDAFGWVIDHDLGLPRSIGLDQKALDSGASLRMTARPDVAITYLGLDRYQAPNPMCGIQLHSPGGIGGNVKVIYDSKVIFIPLSKFRLASAGKAFAHDGSHVHIDNVVTSHRELQQAHFSAVTSIALGQHYFMKVFFLFSLLLFAATILFKKKMVANENGLCALNMISALALSVALPRLGLFSAIDSVMYPGTESRYLAATAFALWFFSSFVVATFLRRFSISITRREF